jgi:isopentenyl diphosphate isomerase/L-lactate dehydrogenase-like FMN-dependent dehydrogenase
MLLNLEDFRSAARRRLPRTAFDVIDAGAADELTLRRNRSAFDRIVLRPRPLGATESRDLATDVCGQRISLPVLLDPCGYARLAHREGELAVARAAGDAATVYVLSTVSSYPLEQVAAEARGPLWYQLYPPADRGDRARLIARAKDAGFGALCVTIDGAASGLRETDKRNKASFPLRLTPRMLLSGAMRPRWAVDFLRGGVGSGSMGFDLAELRSFGEAVARTAMAITPAMIEHIRELWDGPLLLKGVLRGDECQEMIDLGVDGFVVSNHGGRQLDSVPAGIDALAEVVDAVDGRAEVLVDGGFRRGTDVVKALAIGARAVLIGRPYLFGLATAGEAGVARVIEMLRAEIDQTLALLGVAGVGDLDRSFVRDGRLAYSAVSPEVDAHTLRGGS